MATVLGANSVTGGYDVENSLRFNSGSSEYLLRTHGTNHTAVKFAISFWIKRSDVGNEQVALTSYADGNNTGVIRFNANNTLEIFDYQSSYKLRKITNRVFRDISAWYHIVVSVDTAQGTASNRFKLYVNGVQETSFSTNTNYSEDDANMFNKNVLNWIGANPYNSGIGYTNGYMSEFVFIDGTANDEEDFGEFDSDSGIWKPIKVSGLTFGDNGYYLEFKQAGTSQNASGMGADTSGNTDHWAVASLTAIDQTTDTCTNNFCTWNVAADNQDVTFAEGACKVVHGTATARRPVISTFGVANGKWYWEWKAAGSPTAANMEVGIVNYASPTSQGRYLGQALTSDADFTTYIGDGNINVSGSASDSGTAYAGGNIIGVAVDVDNEKIYFYKNNTLINSGGTDYSGMTIGSGFIFMSNADRSGSASYTASVNFGQPVVANSSDAADGNGHGRFEYAPPSGFLALCTKNLAETG